MRKLISIALSLLLCVSCSYESELLRESLKAAGDNRAELEAVLEHYRTVDKDPEKLTAATYLIINMLPHYSYRDTAAINSLSQADGEENADTVSDEENDDNVNNIEEPEITDDEEFAEVDTDDIDNNNDEDEAPEDAEELADDYVDGDDIFDETEEEDGDEISTTPAEEDIPSDEDIIIGDDFDEVNNDNVEGMETVDANTGEVEDDGSEATDIFGGDVEDPIDLNKEVDTELFNPNIETPEYSIVNVMFDGNIKNSTVMKSGSVLVLKPVVSADGSKTVESIEIKFYLSGEDNTPILEMEDTMSTSMYNAVINAITSHPQYADVCSNGVTVSDSDAVD